MTVPAIEPETAEYRELLRALSTRSDAAHMVSAAELETAERLAQETGRTLYRIDLSTIISKYIGETENNLDELRNEVPAEAALILMAGENDMIPAGTGPLIQALVERAALVIVVNREANGLLESLPAPLLAHIPAVCSG